MTDAIIDMAEHLNASTTAVEPGIWLPLLHLLAHGQPIELWDLAAAAGRTEAQIREALGALPDTEYDEYGRIIGRGLTLQPTEYHFEVNGQQLYTWCALDTLIFPTLLATAARIESACHATSTPVLVHIDATGAAKARPATTVVSLVDPDNMASVRSSFCNQVHFFASTEVAQPWLKSHPGGSIVSLDEACRLGRSMAESLIDKSRPQQRVEPGNEVQGGC